MIHIELTKGLDLPIHGEPEQSIQDSPPIRSVALLGPDTIGLKPALHVQVGEKVVRGQPLLTDKSNPLVKYTSPGCGKVVAIHRGQKRVLLSIVIELEGDEETNFKAYSQEKLNALSREDVVANLLESGLWTALRTRPYSKIPPPDSQPTALFVNAMDTNPLAADPIPIIQARQEDFLRGLTVLSKLTDGKLYLCQSSASGTP